MTTYGLYSKIYFLKPGFKDFHQRISVLLFEIISHSPLPFSMILAYTLLPNVSTYFHLRASHILLLKGNDFFQLHIIYIPSSLCHVLWSAILSYPNS